MLLSHSFRQGAREGFRHFLPFSVGLIHGGLVTAVAMRSTGLSFVEASGMSLIVYGGTAQLGTLPLMFSGAPWWLMVMTALALNLRFMIFSATLSPVFDGVGRRGRWLSSYLLSDGVTAACGPRLLGEPDLGWRMGYYLAPSAWGWSLWQASTLAGLLMANIIPTGWPLEFISTIALMVLLIPMVRTRPMLLAALVGGLTAVLLRNLPLHLGLFAAIVAGMATGAIAEARLVERGRDAR